jgi:uncharacterized protein YbbC (DUF1343 family)
MNGGPVRTGLDRIAVGDADAVARVRGKTIGLLAHPASVDSRFVHAERVLKKAGAKIAAYFGPEHGYGGEAQDMIGVEGARAADGAPIYSLYGATFDALSPRPEWLSGLDAVVIDLCDVGSRYYTFVWTAALMLRAANAMGLQTIVLDRPNPLGGVRMEGAPQREGYRSFVGLLDVPVRHGMTIGEIVKMSAEEFEIDSAAFEIIEMEGWDPCSTFESTKLPWVLPSPNMPTVETARVYPGGCLLEGTNMSEGRGTTRPFEIIGAPWVDGKALAEKVHAPGAVLRPLTFEPTFHKHAKTNCGGVQVHVVDDSCFSPYATYVRILAAIAEMADGHFAWRTEPYEFVADRPAIDLLTGGPEIRFAIDRGAGVDTILEEEEMEVARFAERRQTWLLYPR